MSDLGTEPMVARQGVLDMQVCVPEEWDDHEIEKFAEREVPCGTTNGWVVRTAETGRLDGWPERNPCAEREGFVHVIVEA